MKTLVSDLKINQKIKIPGSEISGAINKLWQQNLFSEIEIRCDEIFNDSISLKILLKEYPRLSKFKFVGKISKSNISTLKDNETDSETFFKEYNFEFNNFCQEVITQVKEGNLKKQDIKLSGLSPILEFITKDLS